MHPPQGASPYETWVLTLRAWARDPRTPLDRLPDLAVETFTPDTYARLLDHFNQALSASLERWRSALHALVAGARTPAELAAGLVDLRHTLARSVQLVSHPGLPPEIRDVLVRSNRSDIERYQREFEDAIGRQARTGHALNGEADHMLALVREHSFVAVLDRDLRWDGQELRGAAASLPEPAPTAPTGGMPLLPAPARPAPGRRSYRRITLLGDSD